MREHLYGSYGAPMQVAIQRDFSCRYYDAADAAATAAAAAITDSITDVSDNASRSR